jgi:hypothetical protein
MKSSIKLAIVLGAAPFSVQPLFAADAEIAAETMDSDALQSAKPLHYALTIEPDMANFSFKGQSVIDVEVPSPTSRMSLHAKTLAITKAELIAVEQDKAAIPLTFAADPATELVHFNVIAALKPGRYQLLIDYDGKINSDEHTGLFAVDARGSVYDADRPKEAGPNNIQLFTHAQPNEARTIFPTWDQPGYKMTFDLSLVVPADRTAVSNMRAYQNSTLPSGKTVTLFERTPLMSSYLLFFGIGDFQRKSKTVDGVDYGIVVRENEKGDYNYTLNSMPRVTATLADYYGVPYTLPKMDFVLSARKLKKFQAMENWGAILGSENDAKFDSYIGGGDTRANSYFILAHEITHQWLGNLVTPNQWDDLWLSEGLAVHMTTKLLDKEYPELRFANQYIGVHDSIKSSEVANKAAPVSSAVATTYSDDTAAASIVYEKGGAIVQMIEQAVGADKWQAIMQRYVADHLYQSVTKETLFDSMKLLNESKAAASMRDFVSKPGFPLLTVDSARCDNGEMLVRFSQKPYPGASALAGANWTVPVRARTIGGGVQLQYLDGASGEMKLPGCKAFTLNADASGYYRVDYGNVVSTPNFTDMALLGAVDQYGILLESFANASDADGSLINAMRLLRQADAEQSTEIASLVIEKYTALLDSYSRITELPQRNLAAALIRKDLGPVLEKIGYEDAGGGNDPKRWMRLSLIELLDRADYTPLLKRPENKLPNLSDALASLRMSFNPGFATWSKVAHRNLTLAQWQSAVRSYTKSNIDGSLVGTSKSLPVVKAALNMARTADLEPYSRSAIIAAAASEFPDHVLQYLISLSGPATKMSNSLFFETVMKVAAKSASPSFSAQIKNLFSGRVSADEQKKLDELLVAMEKRHALRTKIKAELSGWIQAALNSKD